MSGVVASQTTGTFTRIFRAHVASVGEYGVSNTGEILIRATGSSAYLMAHIPSGSGQTLMCIYTVPRGKIALLEHIEFSADSGNNDEANFFIYKRENIFNANDEISPRRIGSVYRGVSNHHNVNHPICIPYPALTDIWIEAADNAAGTIDVAASMNLIVADED